MKHAQESYISQEDLGAETSCEDGYCQLTAWQQFGVGVCWAERQAGDPALQQSETSETERTPSVPGLPSAPPAEDHWRRVKASLYLAVFVFACMCALAVPLSGWTTLSHRSLKACRSGPCCHLVLYQRPYLQPKHHQVTYPSTSRSFYCTQAVKRAYSCSSWPHHSYSHRKRELLNLAIFVSEWFLFACYVLFCLVFLYLPGCEWKLFSLAQSIFIAKSLFCCLFDQRPTHSLHV